MNTFLIRYEKHLNKYNSDKNQDRISNTILTQIGGIETTSTPPCASNPCGKQGHQGFPGECRNKGDILVIKDVLVL